MDYKNQFEQTFKKKSELIEQFVLEQLTNNKVELSEIQKKFLKSDISFLMFDLELENNKRLTELN